MPNRARVSSIRSRFATAKGTAKPFSNFRRTRLRAQRRERLVFNDRFECKNDGTIYQEPEPRLFSFNNPWGACPRCQGFGNTIDFDLNLVVPDSSKSLDDGAIEPWTKPRYRGLMQEAKKFARSQSIPTNVAVAAPYVRPAQDAARRRSRQQVRRRQRLLQLSRAQKIQTPRPRIPEPLPRIRNLPRLRRHAPASRSPRRKSRRQIDHRNLQAHRKRSARFLRHAATHAFAGENRRQNSRRSPLAPAISRRSRPRLPHARSPDLNTVRRRVAAHSARDLAWLASRRRALRPRRAVHRPASARHAAPHRHSQIAPRPRQHRARRRTRSRHDRSSRLRHRPRPRRRRTRRQAALRRHVRRDAQGSEVDHRPLPQRRTPHPGSQQPAQAQRKIHPPLRRERPQSAERRSDDSAQDAHRHHRRQRLRQIDARARRPLQSAHSKTQRQQHQGILRSHRRRRRNSRSS